MKKMLLFLCLFGLVCSSAMAKFCFNCGVEIVEKAKFCSSCGSAQSHKSAVLPNKENLAPKIELYNDKPTANNTAVSYQTMKNKVISLFNLVDKFGIHVRGFKYLNVVGNFPDYKVRLANSIRAFNRIKARLPRELQILGMASIEKSSSFTTIIKIMRSFGVNFGYRDAIIKAANIEISLYNDVISEIRRLKEPLDENELQILEKKFRNVERKMHVLTVTSQYLKIGLEKIPTNSKFLVVRIEKRRANILCIGESETGDMVEGFVSLKSLEKRTTWKKEYIEFYQ